MASIINDVLSASVFFFMLFVVRHAGADWQQVASHPMWWNLSELECGDSAADRIIGGINAALGQFPWIARLGYRVLGEDELDWMCGGALLTPRHVVTAAHCVQITDTDIQLAAIRLGEHNTRTNPDCQMNVCAPPIQDRSVAAIRSHKDFNKPAFHNDIAIVELDRPVELNDYVAPICLPQADQLAHALRVGELVTVAGWGTINMTTEQRAEILQVVPLPIVKPEACDSFGRGFKITSSEICAGAQHNKDACGGDSGGPLMMVYDTPDGPKHFLIGVVSFGPTICGIKKPGVYASVSYYLKWILDNLN